MINAIADIRIMITKAFQLVIGLVIFSQTTIAQDSISYDASLIGLIQADIQGEGEISLYHDVLLYHLIENHVLSNEKSGLTGFRIQINQWSGQNSRNKATAKERMFLSKFPSFDKSLVYKEYEAPYYKLRVGDFRSRNEAYEFYNQVRKYFPNSYIVKTNIVYPKLMVKNDATEIY